jgi:RNA polymerase sigma-70 factor (ECF subfamily)
VTQAMEITSYNGQSIEAVVGKSLRAARPKDSVCSSPTRKVCNGQRNAAVTKEEMMRRDALEEIFVATRSKFLAMAYSILQNREDAEEAVQDAFLSAHCNLQSFEGRSALKTWLTRIVLNAALMMRRKRKPVATKSLSETDASNEEDWTESIPDSHPNPEIIHSERETLQFIEGILKKMKPALRQAFALTYFDDLSGAEASARERVSCITFKARLFRARRQVLRRTERAQVSPMKRMRAPSSDAWKRMGLQRV